ncbi:MAG: DUF2065 family protein [Nanoarchaeota archaeon]
MIVKEVVMVIAVLAILEGLFAVLAPGKVRWFVRYFMKKSDKYYRKLGAIEIIVAIAAFVLSYYYL